MQLSGQDEGLQGLIVAVFKVLDLLPGFALRDAMGLLDLARQLITSAGKQAR